MTPQSPKSLSLGPLTGAAYWTGALLILISWLDFGATVWPFRLGDVDWRYGAIGLLSGFTLTPILGGLIIVAVAALAEHRGMLRVAALGHLVAAGALLLLIAAFELDAVQLRRDMASEARTAAAVGAGKAALKLVLTASALVWIGIAGLRRLGPRPMRTEARQIVV